MQKPNNYDNTQAGGDFTPIELGGHTAIVKRVKETTSKSGRSMLQVAIDFDALDSQPGYFSTAFKNDTRQDKKWPFQGTQYILTEDQDGNCSRSFKGFITSVEESNNAECAWGDGFERWFLNKKVGVVYGEVEEEYNGELKTRRRIRYFCNYDKAKTQDIPQKRLLAAGSRPGSAAAAANRPDPNGFLSVVGDMEEVPF